MKRISFFKRISLVMILVATIMVSFLYGSAKVGATGNNLTGTVTNPLGGNVSGVYVYATAPSSSTPLYGPVTTNASGAYTLIVGATGSYDIHFDPPSNSGYGSVVNSSVSVTTNQTLSAQLSSQTNTLSGTLTDNSSTALSGVTVKIFKSGSGTVYQTTTDSSGYYSLAAPAGYYYLYLNGSMSGIYTFTLTQSNTSSINLLTGNKTLNLAIQTATMTVTAYNNAGQQEYGGSPSVTARATSGITSLYPGDPGTGISVVFSNGFSTNTSPTGTITTIVGATYTAPGLEANTYTTSVCKGISGSSSAWDCLRLPLTVNGNSSFDIPATSPATRTFSGTLTDTAGSPISGAVINLIKYGDSSPAATTDANGNFSISVMPKKYALKVTGYNVDGMQDFTLTQSTTNPSIDLTASNIVQNLQVKTASLTVNANDATGSPNYFASVNAQTSAGSTTLYAGDPGETLNITSIGFSTMPSPPVASGIMGTIIGASYSAKGLHATSPSGSICDYDTGSRWNCLTTALTVSGNTTVNTPF